MHVGELSEKEGLTHRGLNSIKTHKEKKKSSREEMSSGKICST